MSFVGVNIALLAEKKEIRAGEEKDRGGRREGKREGEKGREGKRREEKGREGKRREEKGREGKRREEKGGRNTLEADIGARASSFLGDGSDKIFPVSILLRFYGILNGNVCESDS